MLSPMLRKPPRTFLFIASLIAAATFASPAESGFGALCDDCHGMPPLDAGYRNISTGAFRGNHLTHNPAAVAPKASCQKCHSGAGSFTSAHRNGYINMTGNINNSPHSSKATYNKPRFFNQTSNPVLTTCSNVNCHFETSTPEWGSTLFSYANPASNDCGMCHGAPPGGASTGTAGSHSRHYAYYPGAARCGTCHADHVGESSRFAHATSAANRGISVRLHDSAGVAGGSYSGSGANFLPSQSNAQSFGSCANLYCHSQGRSFTDFTGSNAPKSIPLWGTSLPAGCAGCHGGTASAGANAISTRAHGKHIKSVADGGNNIGCNECHAATAAGGAAIASTTYHVDKIVNIKFNDSGVNKDGSFDGVPTADAAGVTKAPGSPLGSGCSNIYCHSDGSGTIDPGRSIRWDGPSAGCTGCHGNDAGSSNTIATGKHRAHVDNYTTLGRGRNFGCTECHASTVSSNSTIGNPANHVNRIKNYSGARAGRISTAGSGRCSTVYCHSTGMKANQFWNMSSVNWYSAQSLSCNGCHGTTVFPDGTFAAFTSVAGESTFANNTAVGQRNSHRAHVAGGGLSDSTGCARCHRRTVDATIAGKLRDYSSAHLDRSGDVAFSAKAGVQGRYSTTTQQCMNIYCHSNASPFDNQTTNYKTMRWGDPSLTCASCHSDPNDADKLSGRHGKHTASLIYDSSCSRCHNGTIDAAGKIVNKSKHADGSKDLVFADGGTYDNSTKGCSVYCHSDANSGPPVVSVKWSDKNLAMQCYSCHKGRASDAASAICNATGGQWSSAKNYCTPDLAMGSNGHERLVGARGVRKYPCTFCHNATVSAQTPVAGKPPVDGPIIHKLFSSNSHVNKEKDVRFDPYWDIVGSTKTYPPASYDKVTKVCSNLYCHSDGTVDPDPVRAYPWDLRTPQGGKRHAGCDSCHGHPQGSCADCHDGSKKFVLNNVTTVLSVQTGWAPADEWKAGYPVYPNGGIGSSRANSHPKHMQKNISCSECHSVTMPSAECTACHSQVKSGITEKGHLDTATHVNKKPEVTFKQGGTYLTNSKSCQSTNGEACHGSTTLKWGDTTTIDTTICYNCHGTNTGDIDNYAFSFKSSTTARINMTEWKTRGHGRMSSATVGEYGPYPYSKNPAANFPGNPCWYCHDKQVMHNYSSNPFRLKLHNQFSNRFDKECVYCHMQGTDAECLICHNVNQITGESLAPQLRNITSSGTRTAVWPNFSSAHGVRPDHRPWETAGGSPSCMAVSYNGTQCHYVDGNNSKQDAKVHNTGAGFWSFGQKADIKNQYLMMGVCLKCHDDDSNGKCNGCHNGSLPKYQLGYDPSTGYIKPKKARASSVHFGYKHYRESMKTGGFDASGRAYGVWKGGKFCWDCHDPHGDSNIYMMHDKVSTKTDGRFGIPKEQKRVLFTQKINGSDYAQKTAPPGEQITGICNVCHGTDSRHFQASGGDGHNSGIICTTCHEHRFTDGHAEGNPCTSCHSNKPVPRHSAFGLPRDCIKCHTGSLGARVDVVGQFKGQSHHVQGIPINNRHCYECHWESGPEGMIDNNFHEGFNYKTYTTVKNAKVDLVLYGAGRRPKIYRQYSSEAGRATAVQFTASNIGSTDVNVERRESAKITNHCVSCHSDDNNDTKPFNDCKTPRQYAWDLQSIAARYLQKGVTKWGKYSSSTVNAKYKVTKALSAHGNAAGNQGGWNPVTGTDSDIGNSRAGFTGMSSARKNVQCFDCHNSHGSKAAGVSSSYVSYSGLRNGANLKEVTPGKGGYNVNYYAKPNTSGVNPYNTGAGLCFDCHMTAMKATSGNGVPWGYQSTFGATMPIKGYRDAYKFGDRSYSQDPNGGTIYQLGTPYGNFKKGSGMTAGGHLKASSTLGRPVADNQQIYGLCTPCHDPHGVSPTLGSNQTYGVPLLKDTWMSSPYKEDFPPPPPSGAHAQGNAWGTVSWGGRNTTNYPSIEPPVYYRIDRNTFGTINGTLRGASNKIPEDDTKYAGLCLKCHSKKALLGQYSSHISPNTAPWKSVERVHASNKWWGANKEHSYTCSKCHQPHNSSLPRLMQTNCLDYQHRGFATGGGVAWSQLKALTNAGASTPTSSWRNIGDSDAKNQVRGYPIGSLLGGYKTSPEASISCHNTRFSSGPEMVPAIRDFLTQPKDGVSASPLPTAQWPDQQFWNVRTPWPLSK